MSINLGAALSLARVGIATFPCKGTAAPAYQRAKEPVEGVLWRSAATTDQGRVKVWWTRHPQSVPAVALGPSSLIVIDLDGPIGLEDWAGLVGSNEIDQPYVVTPSGGRHLYYRQRAGEALGNGRGSLPPKRKNAAGKLEGIDVRGAGGYVIGPGADLGEWGRYELHGDITDPPVIPDWLHDVLTKTKTVEQAPPRMAMAPTDGTRERAYVMAALAAECAALSGTPPGGRNEAANVAAFRIGQLVGPHLSAGEAVEHLEAAARAWGISPKDKALGPKGTIARALQAGIRSPRVIPDGDAYEPVDIDVSGLIRQYVERDGAIIDADTGEIIEAPNVQVSASSAPVGFPGGLVGEIARWIVDTSRRPQPSLAIGAALCLVGTLAGRKYCGPTGSATHLYVLGLAPTASGKDHPGKMVIRILSSIEAISRLKGPGEFMSMSAVNTRILDEPITVCVMDEFGSFLKRINHRKASAHEQAITKVLRSIWSCSFDEVMTPAYAQSSAKSLKAPALSIFGVGTVEEFYDSLAGNDLDNGMINRFLLLPRDPVAKDRDPPVSSREVPDYIKQDIMGIWGRPEAEINSSRFLSDRMPTPVEVPWDGEAQACHRAFMEALEARFDREGEATRSIFGRTAEMAVRMATILAIGYDAHTPCIRIGDIKWAHEMATQSAESMRAGVDAHVSVNDNQGNYKLVARIIKDAGRIQRAKLTAKIAGRLPTRQLREILGALEEAGRIAVVVPAAGAKGPTFYDWTGND